MRFWITKNSEIPLREQLVRQVTFGIVSEDLPAGQKLPSVRALARRHRIHPNTVSAAYHDLLQQGWLELRHGSGLYVRSPSELDGHGKLDRLLAALLKSAELDGHPADEVLRRLEHLVRPRSYGQVLIAEPEPAMREILQAELAEHLHVQIRAVEQPDLSDAATCSDTPADTLVVALPTRVAKMSCGLPPGVLCISLRVRSVGGSLAGESKPGPEVVISIVSRSPEIRYGARAMLIAAGVDPMALCEIDAASGGWRDRIGLNAFVITDIVTARELPAGCQSKVFRVIADSTIAELKQLCRG
jgi:DNA-binding transcriptional regulator YhcF (GntR family)